jgi:hypothetical protein
LQISARSQLQYKKRFRQVKPVKLHIRGQTLKGFKDPNKREHSSKIVPGMYCPNEQEQFDDEKQEWVHKKQEEAVHIPEQGVKKAAIGTAEDKETLRGRNQCGALEFRWE